MVPCARWLRHVATFFFLAIALLLWTEEANARLSRAAHFADGERAIGSSEPVLAAPQEEISEEISPCAAQPAYPAGSLGGLFSRPGLIGSFAAGLLGAGVFGLLFGHGFIGELSGVSSILGLVFQFALLVAFALVIRAWWRADKTAAVAQLSPRQLADAYERDRNEALPDVAADASAGSNVGGKNSFADEAHLPL
jgi:predicted lipid-binding transport protein (Tim44 family)